MTLSLTKKFPGRGYQSQSNCRFIALVRPCRNALYDAFVLTLWVNYPSILQFLDDVSSTFEAHMAHAFAPMLSLN